MSGADDQGEARIEAAVEEYFRAREGGELIDREALLQKYPDLAEALEVFFLGGDLLDGALMLTGRSRGAGAASVATVGYTPTAADPRIDGEPFGRYRLQDKVGQGGMGAVYKAYDTQLDRVVALKIPKIDAADAEGLARFHQEARTAATLSHANLCPVYDVGEHEGRHYLTMLYIPGRTLAALIKEAAASGKLLPQRHVALLVRKLARALDYAHANDVVHRDLKPANVMIVRQGRVSEPLITDFGLARRTVEGGERITQSNQLMGTPAYMPPELASGRVRDAGTSGDIYALGLICYELLTGRLPYDLIGLPLPVILRVIADDPPTPPSARRLGLDPMLEAVCLKALEKLPETRFRSMKAFEAALTAYLEPLDAEPPAEGSTTAVSTTTLRNAAAPRRMEHRKWWAAVAGAVLILVVIAVYVATPKSVGRPATGPEGRSDGTTNGVLSRPEIGASPPSTRDAPQDANNFIEIAFGGKHPEGWDFKTNRKECDFDFLGRGGSLRLSSGAGDDLKAKRLSAPRLVRAFEGDFQLETLVAFSPRHDFQGAGLIVSSGERKLLRVLRAFGGDDRSGVSGVRFDRLNGDALTTIASAADHPTSGNEVRLRIQRTGREFSASWGAREGPMTPLGKVLVDMPSRVEVGPTLCVDRAANNAQAEFEYLRLWPHE